MEETTSTASARQENVKINLFAEKTLEMAASAVLGLGISVAVLGLLIGLGQILFGNGGSLSIGLILCGVSVLILSLLIYSGMKVFADMSVTLKEINAKLK